ncbi:hypothetical protein LY28_02233 [Ruminiclostridium sufflavum DSM 19573]|uniref:Uncharacterized protein n=1 Tax=Ruminiclostridium sufflavum DSM 19573 TaxID=1121337 RepID=A0A318XJA3_9FIRM|nr:hypothetical protein [Ruminiclostridium sufflavum]PYG87325.1 hypothetical protein LY28_02233 [Ruminiclostridium sufflavum DSM 19573]
MKTIDIIALAIIAVGFAAVLLSRAVVKKFDLVQRQHCKYAEELSEEELNEYKLNKAMFNIKITGIIITVPGLILLLVSSRF